MQLGAAVMVEDTSLCFNALQGLPGAGCLIQRLLCYMQAAAMSACCARPQSATAGLAVIPGPYIKWFLEKLGHDGLNRMLGEALHHAARA